jgi:hypothetical protein
MFSFQDDVPCVGLKLVRVQERRDTLDRDNGFHEVGDDHCELRGGMSLGAIDLGKGGLAIPSGNWRSMNNEIAGKMMSAVKGVGET